MTHRLNRFNVVAALAFFLVGAAVAGSSEEEIAQRLKPVGQVCIEGQDCAGVAVEPAGTTEVAARSGEAVYNSSCNACHGTGVAGAPRLGEAADWAARLAQGTEQLYVNAIEGFNAMPALGLCMDCSDEEIKLAVDYMLAGSQ